jgi:multiple sugar transport system permease protein
VADIQRTPATDRTVTGQTPVPLASPSGMRWSRFRLHGRAERYLLALLFVGPAFLVIAAVLLYPIAYNLWLSLHQFNLTRLYLPRRFVGVENYLDALRSGFFWNALRNSLLVTFGGLALEVPIGFALALALNRRSRGKRLFQSIFLLPLLLVPAVVAFMWRFMFQFDGIVNYLLGFVGLDPVDWSSTAAGMLSIILVVTWQNVAFSFIVLLAGLQSIDPDLEAAAMVDGAGPWQRLRYVLLPLMRPFLLVVLAIRTMDLLRVFDEGYVLTGGGPGRSTEMLSQLVYTNSFGTFDIGRGAAISFLQTALTVSFLVVFFVTLHPREERRLGPR